MFYSKCRCVYVCIDIYLHIRLAEAPFILGTIKARQLCGMTKTRGPCMMQKGLYIYYMYMYMYIDR